MSKLEVECNYCGNPFLKWKCLADKVKNNYCNKQCLYLAMKVGKQSNDGNFKKGHKQLNSGRTHLTSTKVLGEKNVNWKGGVTKQSEKIRKSKEYKLWRIAVFERDNYTCVWCYKRGGTLNADHIKPFAWFPEIRFAIDNGRTLCIDCHKKTPSYLNKHYKYE